MHGDTGPGQFLFHNGRLSAIIELELSCFGDPMNDLGNARVRGALYPAGTLNKHFHRYADTIGQPLDREAIMYYTVVWSFTPPLTYAKLIQTAPSAQPMTVPMLAWDASLRRILCEALLEAEGIEADAGPTFRIPR